MIFSGLVSSIKLVFVFFNLMFVSSKEIRQKQEGNSNRSKKFAHLFLDHSVASEHVLCIQTRALAKGVAIYLQNGELE